MATDARNQPQEEEHDGASPGEQLIEAARRNNVDLLNEVLSATSSEEEAAALLNDTKTVLGNHIYHEAALRGNYEIIDTLLDQPLFECDPITRLDADTPLHSAIRFINSLPIPLSASNLEFSTALLSMMTEAGSDPRIKNKAKLTPRDLCDPRLDNLRTLLQEAEVKAREEGEDERELVGLVEAEQDDEGGEGSASDSDDEAGPQTRRR